MKKSARYYLTSTTAKKKDVVTGVVQRYIGRNVSVNLGKVDAIDQNEQVRRGIPADRAHQGLYPGGEGYVQGTERFSCQEPIRSW